MNSLSLARPASALRAAPRVARPARASSLRCMAVAEGAKVKVSAPITVYHVPGKGGLELEGEEGVVVGDVSQFQGKTTNATLKWKVQFETTNSKGKLVKYFVHMDESEFSEC